MNSSPKRPLALEWPEQLFTRGCELFRNGEHAKEEDKRIALIQFDQALETLVHGFLEMSEHELPHEETNRAKKRVMELLQSRTKRNKAELLKEMERFDMKIEFIKEFARERNCSEISIERLSEPHKARNQAYHRGSHAVPTVAVIRQSKENFLDVWNLLFRPLGYDAPTDPCVSTIPAAAPAAARTEPVRVNWPGSYQGVQPRTTRAGGLGVDELREIIHKCGDVGEPLVVVQQIRPMAKELGYVRPGDDNDRWMLGPQKQLEAMGEIAVSYEPAGYKRKIYTRLK